MKLGIIPYQAEELVHGKDSGNVRPRFPSVQKTHEIETKDDDVKVFVKPEDIPLNRRNFVYRPCAPNPRFTELGYCCSEYPFKNAGMNIMDRSDGISLIKDGNDVVSVDESLGWRTSRCDACVKEGEAYWEVEIIRGGLLEPFPDDIPLQKRRDVLNSIPHLRIGISKREASLEAPVGFDSYGYGIRDHTLESIHEGNITQTLPLKFLKPGDRIGLLLRLPTFEEQNRQADEYRQRRIAALSSDSSKPTPSNDYWTPEDPGPNKKKTKKGFCNLDFQKALLEDIDNKNVIRDHIAIRYKNQLFFEATDYIKTTKPEYHSSDKREREEYYHLADSHLSVYLNGEPLGRAFQDLKPFLPPFSELQYKEKFFFDYWRHGTASNNDKGLSDSTQKKGLLLRNKYVNNNKLGYYPTISCFNGGTARIITQRSELNYFDEVLKAHPRPKDVRVLETLYQEQIAEDIVWDIVDEVEEEINASLLKV
ncbi:hypothetical protein HG537_0E04030 [Torulaspora globosa]|uniref:SPRY domain-containing protein n=1 Tax=Torulaspora globosa TaxID=48254 RepID=A0A7H9HTI4_9SACH|nr:hypothetical protein HG537_0E04030 [Torulaspora sp. CBS 2947]